MLRSSYFFFIERCLINKLLNKLSSVSAGSHVMLVTAGYFKHRLVSIPSPEWCHTTIC